MQVWKVRLLRTIGWANILAGSAGLLLVLWRIVRLGSGVVGYPTIIYFSYAFSLMAAIATAWFLCCLLSGIYLLRKDVRGYLLVGFLAVFQVCFTVVVFGLFPVNLEVGKAATLALVNLSHLFVLSYALLIWAVLAVFFRKSDFEIHRPIGGKRA